MTIKVIRGCTLLLILNLILLAGCLNVPQPPKRGLFSNVAVTEQNLHIYTYAGLSQRKNALFIAADMFVQDEYSDALQEIYGSANTPRIEDITWWRLAPYFKSIYGQVVVIPYNKVRHKNVVFALHYLQSLGESFDVYFLTHGLPSRLTDGDIGYFMSWKEIAEFENKLPHLNMVFMQSCFGTTLVEDWYKAGANTVISYPDLNRNFLFIDKFVRLYRWSPENASKAYFNARKQFADSARTDPLYGELISRLGVTADEYLELSPFPDLYDRRRGDRPPAHD